MIQTSIILSIEDNFPIWYQHDGFAKNQAIAEWLFAFCGWPKKYPSAELAICIDIIEWPESDTFFPCNQDKLWILGGCLLMN